MFGDLEMNKKKMGNLGKLSQFSGIKPQASEPVAILKEAVPPPESAAEPNVPNVEEAPQTLSESPKEKLVTVNIKIARFQQEWLAQTARTVRENNDEPVPPAERVFPQHLIGAAIDLLQRAEVDWSQVRNVEDLRKQLNL